MSPGSATQQPYDFRLAAPLLGILQFPIYEMAQGTHLRGLSEVSWANP